jgi:hypothetical protein
MDIAIQGLEISGDRERVEQLLATMDDKLKKLSGLQ